MNSQEPLERLVKSLSRLPAIGRRSAERIAIRLVQNPKRLREQLAEALADVAERVVCCERCGAITTRDENPCRYCMDTRRDDALLCVVGDPGDILSIEQSGGFRGRYFVVPGRLAPMRNEGPEEVNAGGLIQRIRELNAREVILALNADVESDATASYLHDMLQSMDVRISRIAHGLPAGSGIAYSDPVTLAQALQGRVDA